MSASTPNSDSYVLFSKTGLVANFAIKQENDHTLLIEHDPNDLPLVGFVISLGLTAILAYFEPSFALFSAIFSVFLICAMIAQRPIRCIIDKQTQQIHYLREGVFGSQVDRQDIFCEFADIWRLGMKKHASRGSDTFQIILLLGDHRRLALSHSDLSFRQCQEFAEGIRDFLDLDIPIKALEW
jgi:hypothetical protein